MNAFIRPATQADIALVAADLRPIDLEEAEYGVETAIEALTYGYHWSRPCLVFDDGAGMPLCMFGVVPRLGYGLVWMLGTNRLVSPTYMRQFIRASKVWVNDMLDNHYSTLLNVIEPAHSLYIRWLRWLEFDFGTAEIILPPGKSFVMFVRRRKE